MKQITVIDTSVTSCNLGNDIIMDAVLKTIEQLFPSSYIFKLPCLDHFGSAARRCLVSSDHVFFGGTNSFSSHLLRYKQHGFRLRDLVNFRDLTSLGMGWWQYQSKPGPYSSFFWRTLLSQDCYHAVRDSYTKNMLASIGIDNVINTSCPTTWGLTSLHCSQIPERKSSRVVATLTDYSPSYEADLQMLHLLFSHYDDVNLWLQGCDDLRRFSKLLDLFPSITLIPPRLAAYDKFLEEADCDYIGTRLHAGIRALQFKRRALIVAIDNRAREISADIQLNVCQRGDLSAIRRFILSPFVTQISIPCESICQWQDQFV